MRSGKLKNRITIMRPTVTQDNLGGNVVTMANIGTHWAKVTRLAGARSLQYEEVNHSRPYNITLRGNIDVLENDLVIYNGETLTIQSIETDEEKGKETYIVTGAKYTG